MDEIGEAINFPAHRAASEASLSMGDDAEKAAKSLQLSDVTGVPAPIIHNDFDNFSRETGADFASRLVKNNPHLQNYINSHPMAAKVSNDDWGRLDVVSEHLKPLGGLTLSGTVKNFIKGYKEGEGPGGIGQWLRSQPGGEEYAQRYPYSFWTAVGLGLPLELLARVPTGVIHGVAKVAGEVAQGYADIAGAEDKDIGYKTEEGIKSAADFLFTHKMTGTILPVPELVKSHNAGLHRSVEKAISDHTEEIESILKAHIDADEPLSVGLHPAIDKVITEQSKLDAKAADDAFSESQKSTTRERASELYQNFVQQHTDAKVGISSDAIRKLYGDKEPTPDDNILGWVPDIAERLRAAEATGGHVEVPWAETLTRMDPEVWKELHEDMQFRPGGLTLNEGKELEKGPDGAIIGLENGIRVQAGIDPVFAEGEVQNLRLKKVKANLLDEYKEAGGSHTFAITDQVGRDVGQLMLTERYEGKDLYVEWVGNSSAVSPANALGPRLIRTLAKEIQKQFPNAEFISGHRISGAREKAGTEQSKGMVRFPLKAFLEEAPEKSDGYMQMAQELFGGEWETLDKNTKALVPTEAWTENKVQLIGAIDKVLAKMLPKHKPENTQFAEALAHKGRGVQGFYQEYTNSEPIIAIALGGKDPVGVAAHEGVHFLRRNGFFSDTEWKTLSKAAIEGDWLNKPQENLGGQSIALHSGYRKALPDVQLEEAIAHEYPEWLKAQDKSHPANAIFEKMKELFDQIKQAIKEILGFEPTYEDLFKKMESGEIGSREGTKPRDPRAFRAAGLEPAIKGANVDINSGSHPEAKNRNANVELLEATRRSIVDLAEAEGRDTFTPVEIKRLKDIDEAIANLPSDTLFAEQPELPGITRQEDLDLFAKAKAIGMTEKQYRLYKEQIEQERIEDELYMQAKAEKAEKRRQTKEWKDNEKRIREEVTKGIESRPDIAAAQFFGQGMLYGEKVERPKLNTEALTEEQKKLLPSSLISERGIDPDDAANLFGYQSGDALVSKLIEQSKEKDNLGTKKFIEREIDKEVEKQMQAEFGDLEENILEAARDHVFGSPQMDRLHQETLAMAALNNAQFPFSKADVKGFAETAFGKRTVAEAKTARFIQEMGKASKLEVLSLLEGEKAEAFKQAQRKQLAALQVREAMKFQKEQARTEKMIRRYSQNASLGSVEQTYTDQIHRLLGQVGVELRRTDENLNSALANAPLADFIQKENAAGAGILEPNLPNKKALKDFTVDEYRDFAASLKSLDENGRNAKTVEKAGKKIDHAMAVAEIDNNLEDLKKKEFDPTQKGFVGGLKRFGREIDARLIKAEQLIDWIDKNNPLGPFNQIVSRPLFEALHRRGDMIADLAQDIKKIPVDRQWGRNLDKVIDHRYFRDEDGSFTVLTNENKIAMALNWGNRSNRDVLARGREWGEDYIQTFLDTHMTKMDWDFVQGIWGVFKKIAPLVEEATTKRSGVAINMVDTIPIKTQFGTIQGGYYPLIKDGREVLLGKQVKTDLVNKPFFDPLPMARAMKLRTGSAYPVDLTINGMNGRINETLHAALFQDPIRNARKITSDPTVRQGIDKAFGPEYVKQIDKWLEDIANNGSEHQWGELTWISRNARENVVFGLMGYKLSTAVIHGLSAGVSSVYEVGPMALAKNFKNLGIAQVMPNVARKFFANEKEMWKQVDWALETFPELRNRMQDIGRDMHAQISNIASRRFMDDASRMRAANIAWGMKMVATLDQLTATPTAMAAYQKAILTMSHEDAVAVADKAVRQAHGSASLVARANVGRGEAMKWITVAYNGYWNHNYNRMRSAVRDIKAPGIDFSERLMIGSAALTALIIAPAIIHYAIRGSPNDTWTGAVSDSLVSQFGGQVPLVNTLTSSFIHDRDPHVSPMDTILQRAVDIKRDVSHVANGQRADKFLKHVVETPGFFFGLGASDQLGTALQFNLDVYKNKERPKSILEWARGEVTGHTQPPKHKRR